MGSLGQRWYWEVLGQTGLGDRTAIELNAEDGVNIIIRPQVDLRAFTDFRVFIAAESGTYWLQESIDGTNWYDVTDHVSYTESPFTLLYTASTAGRIPPLHLRLKWEDQAYYYYGGDGDPATMQVLMGADLGYSS